MVSEEFYREHILPHDLRIARHFGSVWIHPCNGLHVFRATLEGLPGGLLSERRTITAAVRVHNNEFFNRFLFLLDGKPFQAAGKTAEVTLDPATLKPGRHQLRVVASTVGSVRSQIFSESEFEVK